MIGHHGKLVCDMRSASGDMLPAIGRQCELLGKRPPADLHRPGILQSRSGNQAVRTCMRRLLGASAIILLQFSEGCAVIHVAGKPPTVIPGLGIVVVRPQKTDPVPQLVATESLGISATHRSVTFGYLREISIWVPDASQCRVMVVAESSEDVARLAEGLSALGSSVGNVCMTSREGKEWMR